MTEKIRSARAMIDASGYPVRLQVDGGISRANLAEVIEAGADMVVSVQQSFKRRSRAEAALFQKDLQTLDRELGRV